MTLLFFFFLLEIISFLIRNSKHLIRFQSVRGMNTRHLQVMIASVGIKYCFKFLDTNFNGLLRIQ